MSLTSGHKPVTSKPVTSNHKLPTIKTEAQREEFGRIVREARERLSWTQEELRKRASLHKNTIYNVERGGPSSLSTRLSLANVLTAECGCGYPWPDRRGAFDEESLARFIEGSKLLQRIDGDIAADAGLRMTPAGSFLGMMWERMGAAEMGSISEIEQLLEQRKQLVINFARCCYEDPALRLPFICNGVGIAGLQVIRVLEKSGLPGLVKFMATYSPDRKADPRARARSLQAAYKRALVM